MPAEQLLSRVILMSHDRIVTPLQRIALFAGLKADQLEEIAQRAEKLRFRAGDVVVRAGAPADGAFLIVAGQAEKVHASGEREFLDDRQRAEETRRANEVIAADCR